MDGRPLLIGALILTIVATLPVPRSWSQRKQKQALSGEIMPVGRPDIDNYAKIVSDALNAVVFLDDSQVTHLVVSKVYGEKPGLRIEVARVLAKHDEPREE
jgi:Holliday junction resolvase RusA-like endonuclease